jgi:hypothetical protein
MFEYAIKYTAFCIDHLTTLYQLHRLHNVKIEWGYTIHVSNRKSASVTVMGTGSVYCEVRNEFLNTIHMYVNSNKVRAWLTQPPSIKVHSRASTCENSGGRTGGCIDPPPSTSVFSCSTVPPLLYTYFRLVVHLSSGRAV